MSKNAGISKKPPTSASFKPGTSGNKGGRPKRTPEEMDLIAACKAKAPEALDVIVGIMTHGENERNRITAAVAIIERGYGKAVQPTELTGKDGGAIDLITRIERIIIDV